MAAFGAGGEGFKFVAAGGAEAAAGSAAVDVGSKKGTAGEEQEADGAPACGVDGQACPVDGDGDAVEGDERGDPGGAFDAAVVGGECVSALMECHDDGVGDALAGGDVNHVEHAHRPAEAVSGEANGGGLFGHGRVPGAICVAPECRPVAVFNRVYAGVDGSKKRNTSEPVGRLCLADFSQRRGNRRKICWREPVDAG